ncbi:MAG: T9SS type A sorting domain-containing protein [Bacteroidia bacterium]|nr:T9SS type A sorting domain-containing protein [Bacteroidia bacterium]
MLSLVMRSLFLLLFLVPFSLFATHEVAISMHYECINNCTVRVFHHYYVDCTGPGLQPPNFFNLTPKGASGCGTATALNNWTFVSNVEQTPVCPTFSSGCVTPGSMLNGYQERIYSRDYNICGTTCQGFSIEWSNCCRNQGTNNNSTQEGFFLKSGYIDLTQPQCNNSPYFSKPLRIFISRNSASTHDLSAIDPDGDSLAYSLDTSFKSSGVSMTYGPGFTPQQPFGPSWNLSLDPVTGMLTFDPQNGGQIGVNYYVVKVREFRNGVQIGEIRGEVESYTVPGFNHVPQVAVNHVTGGTLASPFEIHSCPGSQICFDIPTLDADTGQLVTITWNHTLVGATFTEAGVGTPMDSVSGVNPKASFCWTPPGPGTYQVAFRVADNACPVFDENNIAVTLVVGQYAALTTSASQDSCAKFNFSAQTLCGKFSSWSWTGTGGISSSDSAFSHVFPGPGNYTYYLQAVDTAGNMVLDTGMVTVAGVTATAQATLDSCLKGSFWGMGTGNGLAYTWFGDAGLSGTASSLVHAYATGGNYTWTFLVSDGLGCAATVSGVLNVPNPPAPVITPFGDSLVSNYANGNQWFLNGTPLAGGTGPFWIAQQSGVYSLSVQDSLGCEGHSDTVAVVLLGRDGEAGMGWRIAPNPVTGHFDLFWGEGMDEDATFALLDAQGRRLLGGMRVAGARVQRVEMDFCPAGIYFLQVEGKSGGEVRKVLKF